MGFRNARRPRLELLESKTVMSAGFAAGAGAAALSLVTPAAAKLARPVEQTVSLTGSADGDYTSALRKHSTGIKYHLSASGTITPIGSAVVNGWFHAPGSNGGAARIAVSSVRGPFATWKRHAQKQQKPGNSPPDRGHS